MRRRAFMRRRGTFFGLSLLVSLLVFVPVADAALDPTDTATGTGSLYSENGGHHNTADGYFALHHNITGFDNTAIGSGALVLNLSGFGNTALGQDAGLTEDVKNASSTGSRNTFLGYKAGPGTSVELNNATAIGANALVSESNALVLGAAGVKVGVGSERPRSLLQVGVPSTSYGDYLQIPMVTSDSPPPAGDCAMNARGFVFGAGRLVLQYQVRTAKTTLWSCSAAGVWTKLAQG
jgi:hypothetical protein